MSPNRFAHYVAACSLSLGAFAACSSTPPAQLIDARAAYQRASTGPAAQHAQSHLDTAEKALMRAEAEFEDDGDSQDTVDLSYVAQRLARLAEAQAQVELASRERANSESALRIAEQQRSRQTENELRSTKERLAMTEAERKMEAERMARAQQDIQKTTEQLEAERKARMDAEAKINEVRSELEKVAAVREDQRGTVISLSGSVLFTSGKANLIPVAEQRLTTVVEALKTMPNQRIIIEGHTDSQGSEATNQELSERRANSVRDFLVRKGIPSEQIEAVGMGESNPIADNASAEGRANNRRVEIVLSRPTS